MYKVVFVYHSCMDGFKSSHRYECTRKSLFDALEFTSIIANRLNEDYELSYIHIQYLDEDDEEVYL